MFAKTAIAAAAMLSLAACQSATPSAARPTGATPAPPGVGIGFNSPQPAMPNVSQNRGEGNSGGQGGTTR